MVFRHPDFQVGKIYISFTDMKRFSLKLTAFKAPDNGCKMNTYFRFGMAYFQGRTVSCKEGACICTPKLQNAGK